MAQLVITYPDEHRDRIVDAVCDTFRYEEMVDTDDGSLVENVSREEFVKQRLIRWIKKIVVAYEQDKAAREILAGIRSDVDAVDIEIGD